ncbi:MAG TPA: type II toxin-antitoxin system VapC family toxin [Tepidisphaeraceae bacterium]
MIVLDTHVWLWWVDDSPRLKPAVRERIDAADACVSAISLMEIATANARGRLPLLPTPARWFELAQAPDNLRVIPLSDSICLAAAALPRSFHGDPGDRLITALAKSLDVELITADRKILAYREVKTVAAE